jgi:adenylylsulfate kinase
MTGVVVWFTGLPASGKSTLARAVSLSLEGLGAAPVVLDGDEVRAALDPPCGYDDAGRGHFYETLARLAAMLASHGHAVLVPATANLRRYRERARALAPAYLEVFVDTPLEECARRDPKGLYAAQTGALPGVSAVFERPGEGEAYAVSSRNEANAEEIATRVLAALRR